MTYQGIEKFLNLVGLRDEESMIAAKDCKVVCDVCKQYFGHLQSSSYFRLVLPVDATPR